MTSTGSDTKPIEGFLGALVQYPVPIVHTKADIERQVVQICQTIKKTKSGYPGLELIVFPEYSTQGLNTDKWLTEDFVLDIPGPETDAFAQACIENQVYGVFSIIERNPDPNKNPYDTAIIIDPNGEIVLHYRKLQPWVPIEPWYPGDLGMPVCDGPGGSKLAVCVCHDSMFPEIAREAAYKGANVYITISGYSHFVAKQWEIVHRSNAWQNLMYTMAVNLAGYDNELYFFGEGRVVNYDGTVMASGSRHEWEIVTGEIKPKDADNARISWGLENNIYDLGHRGYVAVPGGVQEPGLSYIHDLANGNYHLPWEDKVQVKDGSIYGYPTTGGRFYGKVGTAPYKPGPGHPIVGKPNTGEFGPPYTGPNLPRSSGPIIGKVGTQDVKVRFGQNNKDHYEK